MCVYTIKQEYYEIYRSCSCIKIPHTLKFADLSVLSYNNTNCMSQEMQIMIFFSDSFLSYRLFKIIGISKKKLNLL